MKENEEDMAIFAAYEDQGEYDPVVPEKTLLSAILVNAITDLRHDGVDAVRATEYMLNSNDDYLFSFQSVCNYLGLDPKKILRLAGLLKK